MAPGRSRLGWTEGTSGHGFTNALRCRRLSLMLDLLFLMPSENQLRTNSVLWWGLLFAILGVLSNGLYFIGIPAPVTVWLNLLLPAAAVAFLGIGLVRAFGQPQVYRGKIWGTLVDVIAVLLLAGAVFTFFHARALPRSGGAPQVGGRMPDFTLSDSNGKPVSLSQLLAGSPGGAPPKAVLLIFYRGYW